MARQRPQPTAGEHSMLVGWLEWQQHTVELKCDGVSETDAHHAPLGTSPDLTIAGLVAHLASVERDWLEGSFLGNVELLSTDSHGGWRVNGQTLADLLASYRHQTARSREILAGHDLDELEAYAPPGLDLVSLRWILAHLIEGESPVVVGFEAQRRGCVK